MEERTDALDAVRPWRIVLLAMEIRRARQAAGMTQAQLGWRMGFPQSVVSSWEAGFVGIRLEVVHLIEVNLGLAPGTLLIASGYVRVPGVEDPVQAILQRLG